MTERSRAVCRMARHKWSRFKMSASPSFSENIRFTCEPILIQKSPDTTSLHPISIGAAFHDNFLNDCGEVNGGIFKKDSSSECCAPGVVQMSHRLPIPRLRSLTGRTPWKGGAACEDLSLFIFHPGLVWELDWRPLFLRPFAPSFSNAQVEGLNGGLIM